MLCISNDLKDFEYAYADMREQFPACELKAYEHLEKLFVDGIYKLVIGEHGYMMFFAEEEVLWLDYFAVFKNFHSQGIGSKMLKEVISLFPEHMGCYIEVEKPDKDKKDTLRRIDFYKKNGAVKLDINYYFPGNVPLAMDLYFLSFNKKNPDNRLVLLSVERVFRVLHSDVSNYRDVLRLISCPSQFPQEGQ